MIDHIGISVTDFEAAKAFYDTALRAARRISMHHERAARTSPATSKVGGYGRDGKPSVAARRRQDRARHATSPSARSRAEVDAFYAAAIAAGGKDNGAPGLRPHYHPNYYGAFVLDPDGNNIEAVCHQPE